VLGSIYGPKWLPAVTPLRVLAVGLALVGLRLAIGTVYYAKGYPSFDIYLNGVHLLLIVAAVGLTAPMGLIAVCAGVSIVEGAMGLVGQYVVCLLVGIRLRELVPAVIPGLRITAACAAATLGGKLFGAALEIHAPLILAFVAAPPAAAFCWLQADEVQALVRLGFGGRSHRVADVAEA